MKGRNLQRDTRKRERNVWKEFLGITHENKSKLCVYTYTQSLLLKLPYRAVELAYTWNAGHCSYVHAELEKNEGEERKNEKEWNDWPELEASWWIGVTAGGVFILFSPLTAFSRISWSSLQKSPSSLSANSSPGTNCLSHATHRKHCWWYILLRALITKSFLLKHCPHLLHFVPNSLQKNIITVNIHHPYQNGNHPSQHVVTTITTKLTPYGVSRKMAKIIIIAQQSCFLPRLLLKTRIQQQKNPHSHSFLTHVLQSI